MNRVTSLDEYERLLAPARECFEASPGVQAIRPNSDDVFLELFLLHFCALESQVTSPFAVRPNARTSRSHSRSKKRISEQRSAIARGLSIVSDCRSSRRATAPIRSELTSRKALEREMNGKSSSTEVRAKTVREPKCFNRASACF